MADIARLSLNQATTERWSVAEAVAGCVRHGISTIGLWRHKVEETGLKESARIVREAGLNVSSLCRGGMFVAASADERKRRLEDNFLAVQECAELQANSLVMVVGASVDVPLPTARTMVKEALAALVPYAHSHGVRLGLEPLHPMFTAERWVLNTIDQALEMAAPYSPADVGLILDTFHIWWDPRVLEQIAKAAGRIYGFHVSDWLVPLPDILMGRAIMGEGVVDNKLIHEAVERAGYNGPIEVEVFNQSVWDAPCDEVVDLVIERFAAKV